MIRPPKFAVAPAVLHLTRFDLVRHSYSVTTTISSKGQVVIPRLVRERHKFRAGDDLILLELSNGDILLRHARKPKHSLVWHLRRLHGLDMKRSRERVREVAW